jgi:hypothetical protein
MTVLVSASRTASAVCSAGRCSGGMTYRVDRSTRVPMAERLPSP